MRRNEGKGAKHANNEKTKLTTDEMFPPTFMWSHKISVHLSQTPASSTSMHVSKHCKLVKMETMNGFLTLLTLCQRSQSYFYKCQMSLMQLAELWPSSWALSWEWRWTKLNVKLYNPTLKNQVIHSQFWQVWWKKKKTKPTNSHIPTLSKVSLECYGEKQRNDNPKAT